MEVKVKIEATETERNWKLKETSVNGSETELDVTVIKWN